MRNVFPDLRTVPARIRAATPPHTVRPWPLPASESERVTELSHRLAACHGETELRALEKTISTELATEGMPIWEEDSPGWALVTFILIKDAPHGVALQLNRMTDPIDVADTLLSPLSGSRVHALTLRVPDHWMGSYLYVPLPAPPQLALHCGISPQTLKPLMAATCEDPLAREYIHNKHQTSEVQTAPRFAVACGPAAPDLALWRNTATPVREVDAVRSEVNGSELPISVWSYPEADMSSPVLVLADGEVWREQFPLATELTRRIDAGEFSPVHMVFLDSGGSRQRQLDYPVSAEQSKKLLDSVRASIADEIGEGPWIVIGQSLGGLFAALCATRHPDQVAAAIAQSPSLWWPAAPPHDYVSGWFEERAATDAGSPILIESGIYDWLLIERTRDAAALLRAQHALIDYNEFAAGHDILQWQATLPDAISRTVTHIALAEETS